MSWLVLLVDGDDASRGKLERVLVTRGYRVAVARDARGALDLLRAGAQHPSVVVVDLALPATDVDEIVHSCRTHRATRDIAIVGLAPELDPRGSAVLDMSVVLSKLAPLPALLDEIQRACSDLGGWRSSRQRAPSPEPEA